MHVHVKRRNYVKREGTCTYTLSQAKEKVHRGLSNIEIKTEITRQKKQQQLSMRKHS